MGGANFKGESKGNESQHGEYTRAPWKSDGTPDTGKDAGGNSRKCFCGVTKVSKPVFNLRNSTHPMLSN